MIPDFQSLAFACFSDWQHVPVRIVDEMLDALELQQDEENQ